MTSRWEMGKKKEPKEIMGRRDSQYLEGWITHKSIREPKALALMAMNQLLYTTRWQGTKERIRNA